MNQLAAIIAETGVTVAVVALFIYSYLVQQKNNTDTLKRIDETNKNIAEAVKTISKSVDVLQGILTEQQKDSKVMRENINYIKQFMERK